MPTFDRQKMCAECPFRAKAAFGWLGPWSIDDFEEMIQYDQNFICHVEVGELKEQGMPEPVIEEVGQHCVGFLRYLNSMLRLSRDAQKSAAQRALKTVPDQPVIEARKFREHHERMIKPKKDKRKRS